MSSAVKTLLCGALVVGGMGFVDYLQNNANPFSKQTLVHAALGAAMAMGAYLLKSPLVKSDGGTQ